MLTSKLKIRKELLLKLEGLTNDEIAHQSNIVCSKIIQNEKFQMAKVVSVYLSMTKEIQTTMLLKKIFEQGKDCFIPRFQPGSSEMEMIRLKSLDEFYSLPFNKWNIRQPPSEEQRQSIFELGRLDVVFTPGLGFTTSGKRIGRGKGYYDKFFTRCLSNLKNPPYTIGLAFNEQILEDIPVTEYDHCLDLIIHGTS